MKCDVLTTTNVDKDVFPPSTERRKLDGNGNCSIQFSRQVSGKTVLVRWRIIKLFIATPEEEAEMKSECSVFETFYLQLSAPNALAINSMQA